MLSGGVAPFLARKIIKKGIKGVKGFMDLKRKETETIKDYKIRLFRNKDLYNIGTEKIAELINAETGDNFSESTYRKWFRPYQEGFEDGVRNALKTDSLFEEYEDKRIELEKEKVKFRDSRNAYNKDIRSWARGENNLDIILEAVKNQKPYPSPTFLGDNFETTDKTDLLVFLNDIHYGAEINNHWNKYNSNVVYERMSLYLKKIVKIQQTHGSQNCFVCANGDLINGNIHMSVDLSNRENVVEQVMGVSEVVAYFLNSLTEWFDNVYFTVVSGNHSRLRKQNIDSLYERMDDLVPWYIQARLQTNPRVHVITDTIDRTLSVIDIRGKNYLNVHGDYDGIKTVEKVVSMVDDPVYAICFGHLHHNITDWVQGYKILMSGSLIGMDNYCISKRILGKAQQLVCVCNEDGVVTTYDVDLQ